MRLNLGCGKWPMDGWLNIDTFPPAEGDDWTANPDRYRQLDLDGTGLWPFDIDSVDEVHGSHVIEHLHHPLRMMQNLWRVCKPDARATFACPYGSSDDAWENPTHVRPMFVGSWSFFGQPNYWREDYGYRADWVVEEVRLRIRREKWNPYGNAVNDALRALWDDIQTSRNVVSEMVAVLRCNKPARAADRELQETKDVVIEVLSPVSAWENEVREVGRLRMGLPR